MTGPNVTPAHVLLVENQLELSRAITRTLERAGLQVKAAASHAKASALIDQPGMRFDAAVLDHRLPDGDSRDLVSVLAGREPSCSCLILTAHLNYDLAREYRGRGAFRVAQKPLGGIQLLAHVHATMIDTHRWRKAGIRDAPPPAEPPPVVVDFEQAADRLKYIAKLSPTEREVAYWMLQDLDNAQIARMLGRDEHTAIHHVSQVLVKVGAQHRADLWSLLHPGGETLLHVGGKKAHPHPTQRRIMSPPPVGTTDQCKLEVPEKSKSLRSEERHRADRIIDELARVAPQPDVAMLIAERAGSPRSRIPAFSTPLTFWTAVAREAERGLLHGGIHALTEIAAELFPENEELAHSVLVSRRLEATQSQSSRTNDSPSATAVASHLQAAYQAREGLAIAGSDTTEIDTRILELRRQQRCGPTLHPENSWVKEDSDWSRS